MTEIGDIIIPSQLVVPTFSGAETYLTYGTLFMSGGKLFITVADGNAQIITST